MFASLLFTAFERNKWFKYPFYTFISAPEELWRKTVPACRNNIFCVPSREMSVPFKKDTDKKMTTFVSVLQESSFFCWKSNVLEFYKQDIWKAVAQEKFFSPPNTKMVTILVRKGNKNFPEASDFWWSFAYNIIIMCKYTNISLVSQNLRLQRFGIALKLSKWKSFERILANFFWDFDHSCLNKWNFIFKVFGAVWSNRKVIMYWLLRWPYYP